MRTIVATTGEPREYSTEFGGIEFIHVEHSLENTLDTGYPLRLAKSFGAMKISKESIGTCILLFDMSCIHLLSVDIDYLCICST
ncbi:hypothetical protein [Vibrio cyclitrophicus]|nr:hypothetical protein [Vibrio cyclitrophicus]